LFIGDKLTQSDTDGQLWKASSGDEVLAVLLQPVSSGADDIVAIDIQRGGLLP